MPREAQMPQTADIYFDHNATTPLRPDVLDEMLPYLQRISGNPSSLHSAGQEAKAGVDDARERIAHLLGCDGAEEIRFTSGGTEADNWAVKGVAARAGRQGRIVTSAIEHHAVWHSCRHLGERGYDVVYVPVDGRGVVDVDAVISAIDGGDTILVSIMHANNETGVVQPAAEIGRATQARGIPFHVDAVQSFGKIAVRADALNADLISISAHKINGPKGVGALYVRSDAAIEALSHGGEHEGGLRAGTENVAGIVGFGAAAAIRSREMVADGERLEVLRSTFERNTISSIDDVTVNGGVVERLPNTSSLTLIGVEAEAVIVGLDLRGVAVSSGSACASGSAEPSHVLTAMGLEPRQAASSVRFSFGWGNTIEEVERLGDILPGVVEKLRRLSTATF